MASTPHETPAPSEPAPSVPQANAETPVNAPGPIVIDNFSDVCRLAWLVVTRYSNLHLVGHQQ
jgi:hypothetical protein